MSPTSTKDLNGAEAIGIAVATALLPVLNGLREDSTRRHEVANGADTALQLASIATADIKHLTSRVNALTGDGSGDNGQIASMQKTMRATEKDVQDIKGDMKTVLTTMTKLETNSNSSRSFMDGWKGVALALSIGATLITVIGGIAATVLWLYKH